MMFFPDALSQTGTTRRAARGFLLLGALLGCAQDETGTGTPLEEERINACTEKAAEFVAAHRACTSDSDCVIVGDCSHANFQAVAKDAADEARALVLACTAFDGPTYNAVCRANECERVPTGQSCGQATPRACPAGMQWERPGCGSHPGDAAFVDGCYASCEAVGDDGACPTGHTCQRTTRDPCIPASPGGIACEACGAHDVTLCLPAPDCDLELAITFYDGLHTEARLAEGGSIEMSLLLINRASRALTLEFDVPCHGPAIAGLGSYDVWNSCLAGVCETDPVSTRVSLAVGEKLRWRSAVLTDAPSSCNPAGLPDGRLALSFALANLKGAKVCGPAAATLISGPAS